MLHHQKKINPYSQSYCLINPAIHQSGSGWGMWSINCKPSPPTNSLLCSSYCWICARFVHCYSHPLILLHTLPSFHPLYHQLRQLPPFLFYLFTSHHQMLNVFYLSTSTVLTDPLFSFQTPLSSSFISHFCCPSSQLSLNPSLPLTVDYIYCRYIHVVCQAVSILLHLYRCVGVLHLGKGVMEF